MEAQIGSSLSPVLRGRRLWSGVSRSERRRIKHAVKHDELLRNPEDAEKVVEVAARFRRKRRRRPGLLFLAGALVVIAAHVPDMVLATRTGPEWLWWLTLLAAVVLIGGKVWEYFDRRRSWDRWEHAEDRHFEYLDQLGLPDPRRWRSIDY